MAQELGAEARRVCGEAKKLTLAGWLTPLRGWGDAPRGHRPEAS